MMCHAYESLVGDHLSSLELGFFNTFFGGGGISDNKHVIESHHHANVFRISSKKMPTPNTLSDGELAAVDAREVYYNFVKTHCLGKTHLKGFDEWIGKTIYESLTSAVVSTQSGHKVRCDALEIRKPSYLKNNRMYPLMPAYAKAQLLTYAVTLMADMVVEDASGEIVHRSGNIDIGSVPVMVKSIKCNLRNLTHNQLVACGEDPADVGGYFIVNGGEYVVMYMEKLDMNKFIMFNNKKEKGDMDVTITTLNVTRKTSIQVVFYSKNNRMVMVNLPSLNTPSSTRLQNSVNIFHILNIFKFGDIKRFDTLVSLYFTSKDNKMKKKLLNLLCMNRVNLSANPDSVDVISAMLSNTTGLDQEAKEAVVLAKVQKDIFAHLGYYFRDMEERAATIHRNTNKVHILAYCTAMLLEQQAGIRSESDRDSWSNKRIEASSKAMEYLLKNAWDSKLAVIARSTKTIDELGMKKIAENLAKPIITDSFVTSFCTLKWGVKNKPTMKTDRAQYIVQESPVHVQALLDQIQVSMSRTDKQTNARLVQETQYGFVDPVYCTEGVKTGLIKSISATVQISPWDWGNDLKIISYLLDEGICQYTVDAEMPFYDYVFVNAVYVGWGNGDLVVEKLRAMKLACQIPRMTSISKKGRMVSVHTTPFRLVRPVIVVDPVQLKPVYEVLGLS